MARKTIKDLNAEIDILKARLLWSESLNHRLANLLKDARDHFGEVGKNIEMLVPIVHNARDVYAKVVTDLKEALTNERSKRSGN